MEILLSLHFPCFRLIGSEQAIKLFAPTRKHMVEFDKGQGQHPPVIHLILERQGHIQSQLSLIRMEFLNPDRTKVGQVGTVTSSCVAAQRDEDIDEIHSHTIACIESSSIKSSVDNAALVLCISSTSSSYCTTTKSCSQS